MNGLFAVLGTVLFAATMTSEVPPPPTPDVSEASKRAVQEGTARHDAGDYAGAIRIYDHALASDPANVSLLYEKAYSSYAMKDLETARRIAIENAPHAGRLAPALYVLLGNVYDDLKQPEKAVEAYEAGLKLSPDDPHILYNLAVTRLGRGENAAARDALKRELARRSNHASGHFLLAESFRADGYRVPAVLAYIRFLGLEPKGTRAEGAARKLMALLDLGVERKDEKNVQLTVDASSKKDEGDFSTLEMALAIVSAGRFVDEQAKLSELERRVGQLRSFTAIVSETSKVPSTFVELRYVTYVTEMNRKGFVEPFSHLALAAAGIPGASDWLSRNQPKADEFLAWSQAFTQPSQ